MLSTELDWNSIVTSQDPYMNFYFFCLQKQSDYLPPAFFQRKRYDKETELKYIAMS